MNDDKRIHPNMKATVMSAYQQMNQHVVYVLYVSHKGKRARAEIVRLDAPYKPCKCMFTEHSRYTNLMEAIDERDKWLKENRTTE